MEPSTTSQRPSGAATPAPSSGRDPEPSRGDRSTTAITLLGFAVGYPMTYGVHVLFSRWLAAEAYGDVAVAIGIATLVSTVALLGLDGATMLFVGSHRDPSADGEFIAFAATRILVAGFVLSLSGWAVAHVVEVGFGHDEHPLREAMALVLPLAATAYLAKLSAGLGRPVAASVVSRLVLPLALLALAGALSLGGGVPTEGHVLWVVLGAHLLVASIFLVLLRANWRQRRGRAEAPPDRSRWWAGAHAFLVTSLAASALQHGGVLLLEFLGHDEAAVGVFHAANFTAALPIMMLGALRLVTVPRLAARHAAGDADALVLELGRTLRFLAVTAALALALLVVFGREILGLFGPEFVAGYGPLMVLGLGSAATLMAGVAVPLLLMVEDHRAANLTSVALVVLDLGLAAILVPSLGAMGAALAFTAAALPVSIAQVAWLQRRHGIPYLRSLRTRSIEVARSITEGGTGAQTRT